MIEWVVPMMVTLQTNLKYIKIKNKSLKIIVRLLADIRGKDFRIVSTVNYIQIMSCPFKVSDYTVFTSKKKTKGGKRKQGIINLQKDLIFLFKILSLSL